MTDEPTSSTTDEYSRETMTSPTEACLIHNNDKGEKRLMARIDAQTHQEEDDHDDDEHAQNSKKVAFMISITFLFFLVELTVGFLNRSIALLADSYHMLSDVMALTVALICLQLSRRKSKRNGFGWVRAEVLGALVNGVFLLAMCFTISLESIGRLLHPRQMTHPLQVLTVGIIGLLINLVGIGLFHGGHGHSHGGGGGHGHSHGGGGDKKKSKSNGHGHSHAGGHGHSHAEPETTETAEQTQQDAALLNRTVRSLSHLSNECSHNHLALRLVNLDETSVDDEFDDRTQEKRNQKMKDAENLNMRGVLLHIISDAIGSVFVIITASLAYWVPDQIGPVADYLDPLLSLCLVALICISAYRLVCETAGIILGRPPVFVDFDDIKKDISKIRGVAFVEAVSVWTLVANRHIGTANVEFCSVAAFEQATPKIRKYFHGIGIHSLTLQPSFSAASCEVVSVPPVDIVVEVSIPAETEGESIPMTSRVGKMTSSNLVDEETDEGHVATADQPLLDNSSETKTDS